MLRYHGTQESIGIAIMRASVRLMAGGVIAAAALALAACDTISEGLDNAYHYDGATPGTVPGHIGEPGGPMPNGLMPEPWGSTS
jgi:hypothetical protein